MTDEVPNPLALDTWLDRAIAAGAQDCRDPAGGQRDTILQIYDALVSKRRLKDVLLVELRCGSGRGRGCLLLHCFNTPHGRLVVHPSYRWSPHREGRTNPTARAWQSDGNQRWMRRAFRLEDAGEAGGGGALTCDHLLDGSLPDGRLLQLANAASPGIPVLRRGAPW